MPLETDIEAAGKYISDLNRSWPIGSTDYPSSLDNHIRGQKNTLLNTLPNITGPVTLTQDEINATVPRLDALDPILNEDLAGRNINTNPITFALAVDSNYEIHLQDVQTAGAGTNILTLIGRIGTSGVPNTGTIYSHSEIELWSGTTGLLQIVGSDVYCRIASTLVEQAGSAAIIDTHIIVHTGNTLSRPIYMLSQASGTSYPATTWGIVGATASGRGTLLTGATHFFIQTLNTGTLAGGRAIVYKKPT